MNTARAKLIKINSRLIKAYHEKHLIRSIHLYCKIFLSRFMKKYHERRNAFIIKNKIKENCVGVTIVYDNLVSPPTFGDFFTVAMFCRFFAVKNLEVNLFIFNDGFRNDWKHINSPEKFVHEQIKIVNSVNHNKLINVRVLGFEEFKNRYSLIIESQKNSFFFSRNKSLKRRKIYDSIYNILNILMANECLEFKRIFLLSERSFSLSIGKKNFPLGYVAWHCRYNERWGSDRNLSKLQFIDYYSRIRMRFSNMPIIIVSDVSGCMYYKKIAVDHSLNLSYSKDFTKNFLEDVALVLGSSFYFQLRGGGIGMAAIFSNIPYEIIDPCSNESPWDHPKFSSWANPNQNRYFSIDEVGTQ